MIKKTIKLYLYLLAFIPFIVDFKVFFPYTSAKNLFIQTLLLLAYSLFLFSFFYTQSFREEVVKKVTKYLKHSLVISILSFTFIMIFSTILAVDKNSAFWGDLSRAEGLSNFIFFFAFFILTLLTFEKKDYLCFCKLSLFTSLILISHSLVEFFYTGITRPGSYTGNPAFLAGYLLFSISSGLIVLNEVKGWFFKYLGIITITLSTLIIFLTQTRSAILGLGVGIFGILMYFVFKGKDIKYKVLNLRQFAIILLTLGIIFSGIFISTRKNEFWQKVPGLARIAMIGEGDEEDPSTEIRLYVYKSSLKALNPRDNGLSKLLIGWGPDNFILADSQYYYAEQYKYEQRWYDRAHNKFLDVLVMNGVFGLLAYFAIWFMFFRFIFKKQIQNEGFRFIDLSLLFFSLSYLTHLMFVFDQISTSIPFFMILTFSVYYTSKESLIEPKKPQIGIENKERGEILTGTFLVILTVFLVFVYVKNTLPGYYQMRSYTALIENPQVKSFENDIDSVFTKNTHAQMNIRRNFLEITNNLYNKNPSELNGRLLKKAILKAEEYIEKRPLDFGFQATLADMYTRKGNTMNNAEYMNRGEELLLNILSFAPNRPDMQYRLALNFFMQGREVEAFELYESTFAKNSSILEVDRKDFESLYTNLVKYFYNERDKENLLKVADRLRANGYGNMGALEQILDHLNKTGKWPVVDFQ